MKLKTGSSGVVVNVEVTPLTDNAWSEEAREASAEARAASAKGKTPEDKEKIALRYTHKAYRATDKANGLRRNYQAHMDVAKAHIAAASAHIESQKAADKLYGPGGKLNEEYEERTGGEYGKYEGFGEGESIHKEMAASHHEAATEILMGNKPKWVGSGN